jgi:hypothetical protein
MVSKLSLRCCPILEVIRRLPLFADPSKKRVNFGDMVDGRLSNRRPSFRYKGIGRTEFPKFFRIVYPFDSIRLCRKGEFSALQSLI